MQALPFGAARRLSSHRTSTHAHRARLSAAASCAVEALELRTLFAFTPTPITAYHGNLQSNGVNNTETLLTPATVNVNQFGKQFSTPVDGQVYAEPLYVPGLNITSGPQQGVHNVVFVATEHDSLYAIDSIGGNVLWKRSFQDVEDTTIADGTVTLANPLGAAGIAPMPASETNSGDLTPEIGITATPVIDLTNNAIFLVAKSKQNVGGTNDHYVQILYKVDIRSGGVIASKVIADTRFSGGTYTYITTGAASDTPFCVGTGDGNITVNLPGGGTQRRIYFNGMREFGRVGLTLFNGVVYMGFASHGDNGPYHGWMLGYNTTTLAVTGALNTTPTGGLGGIWQGGGKINIDPQGNFYFETGNGSFNTSAANFGGTYNQTTLPIDGNYGDSFVKVSLDPTTNPNSQNKNGWGLKVVDYFSPFNNADLNGRDADLGSAGMTILPDAVGSAAHPHLAIGSGKEGKLYLVDRDHMGGFDPNTDHVVQELAALNGLLNQPGFFLDQPTAATPSGALILIDGYGGASKSYRISNGGFALNPSSQTAVDFGYLPGSPTISSDGVQNGIVWAINRNTSIVYAYRADNLASLLWNSGQAPNGRDNIGSAVKFSVPSVADGQLFVGTANSLVVFGPPVPPTAPPAGPSSLTASAPAFNKVVLNWSDLSSNEDMFRIERTLTPNNPASWAEIATVSTNVTSYTDTTTLATTAYSYRVRAYNSFNGGTYSGYTNVATVTTPQAPPTGTGDGLAAFYFNDVNGVHLSGNPALTRVDAQVLTNWGDGSPGAPIGINNFSARWTGRVQAQFSQTYTFYTNSDDGVRLYIKPTTSSTFTNVIDNFTDHGPTENSGTFTMSAGQRYDIKMEFYENGGGAVAQLSWSSLSTDKQFIPQSQLYSGVAPAAPTVLTATPAASVQVNLAWHDNANIETGYFVERKDPGGSYQTIATLPPNSTSYIDAELFPNTTYSYRVTATNFATNSPPSNVVTLTTPIPPAKPTDAHATAVTKTTVAMAWTDNANNEDGYRVIRVISPPDEDDEGGGEPTSIVIAQLPPNSTSYTDNGPLTPGSHYGYHIQAYNVAGYNDFSGFVTDTIADAPTGLSATPGDGRVTLNWTAPSFGTHVNLTFNVYRGTTPNGQSATPIATGVPALDLDNLPIPPTFTDTTAVSGTTYYYKVTAIDLGGESVKSNETSAAAVAIPPVPQTLTVNGGSPQRSSVTLLNVAFGQPLGSADAGAFVITRLSDSAIFTPLVALAPDGKGFNLTFNGTSGAGVSNGSLPDGVYTLVVHPNKVHNANGSTGSATAVSMPQFHRYLADINGDGKIGPEDFNVLASHFGQTGQTPATGDLNGDGTVGPDDFNLLASRFGTSVPGGSGLVAAPPFTGSATTTTTTASSPTSDLSSSNEAKPKRPVARRPSVLGTGSTIVLSPGKP